MSCELCFHPADVGAESAAAKSARRQNRFSVELLARTVAASKDGEGNIFWLELERNFHHKLVTMAFAVCKRSSVQAPTCDLKVALFDFLLGVVNGRPQQAFFDAKEVEARSNRANRERKRLARKRARAARRERERESQLLDTAVRHTGASRSCVACGKKFASRKRHSKHVCEPPQPEQKEELVKPVSEATRRRRAKARLARKLKNRQAKTSGSSRSDVVAEPALQVTEPTVAANKLTVVAPVTGKSGLKFEVECGDCGGRAIGVGRGRWPKCAKHAGVETLFWLELDRIDQYKWATL